jgi:hypothetical protein
VPEARSSTFLTVGDRQGPVVAATDEASITPIQKAGFQRCGEKSCEVQWNADAFWRSGVLDAGTDVVGSSYDQSFNGIVTVFYRQTPAEDFWPFPE